MAQPAVQADGLVKRYAGVAVVDGVDLEVAAGSVFALLGPNGAGKTTTVRMLATLAVPDEGSAAVAGHDVVRGRRQVRRRISVTGQFAALDELATGYENLHLMARLTGRRGAAAKARAQELIEAFDLSQAAHRRVSTYWEACGAGSIWQPDSSASPRCSSSTSRPPVWIRAAANRSGKPSASWSPAESRSA